MNEAPRYSNVSGSGGIASPFLTSALDGDESSASRPSCFNLVERTPEYRFDKRLGGPQASLDAVK
jgi:hypothetical protein